MSTETYYPHEGDNTTDSWHSVRQTSIEVARLIWAEAQGDAGRAEAIWENGSEAIDSEAQVLANSLGEDLYWGDHTYAANA